MDEMVITFKGEEGFCELTDEMDQYFTADRPDWFHTYIRDFGERTGNLVGCDGKPGHIYVMRAPGATRGCIYTDGDGVIESVNFYEDSCYEKLQTYKREMENIKDKYIGRKIICK